MIEYQYSTNPKKYYPEYTSNNKKKKNNNVGVKKNKYSQNMNTNNKNSKALKGKVTNYKHNELLESKKKARKEKRNTKIYWAFLFFLIITLAILIVYRNSYADEKFMQLNKKTKQIEEMKKENEQLKLSLQNSMSLNKIEEKAKNIGMQKLDSSKIVKISLPKKDFIEPSEKVTISNKKENIITKIYKSLMRII